MAINEIRQEEYNRILSDLNADNLTENRVKLLDMITEDLAEGITTKQTLTTREEENKNLKEQNYNLFLKITGTETPTNEQKTITNKEQYFNDLIKKGVL